MMESPRLPWEVIENVIGHSGDRPNLLASFSLTCRQLLPRSRCIMFTRVTLKSRDQVFAFVDFLEDNPHLKPFVQSMVVRPTDLAPFPLLYILPNLSEIRFTTPSPSDLLPALHHSSLACFQRFGTHIQTLDVFDIHFATYLSFARILLAFPNIAHLTCTRVVIKEAGNSGPLDVMRHRLSKQMKLKTLTVSALDCLRAAIVKPT
ncbi:hypothetical protein LXA43DRAFT_953360 [Ganoderma leucocontextum]|nr:hypothetical protein LXA43DRAFT_953360 [Ganoderma leucocontextum]